MLLKVFELSNPELRSWFAGCLRKVPGPFPLPCLVSFALFSQPGSLALQQGSLSELLISKVSHLLACFLLLLALATASALGSPCFLV